MNVGGYTGQPMIGVYIRGFTAARIGQERSENPYARDFAPAYWRAWNDGFTDGAPLDTSARERDTLGAPCR